jgi:hypothetical protein
MDWLVSLMTEHSAVQGLVKTGILLGAVLMIRIYGLRKVRQSEGLNNELRRRSIIQIRRASWFLLLFGSLFIWGPKFQGLAVSLLAFAVAIVLAFKELILCVLGAMLKTSARSFTIGDRIEINDLRGDVFDQTLLTTTLLEVGPGKATHQHTGRKIVIPNSLFLNTPVMNDSAAHEFVLHVFTVSMRPTDPWREARTHLLRAATEECAGFIAEARSHMEKLGVKEGIPSLSVEPRITIRLPEPDRIDLVVRIPAPIRKRGRLEQAILNRYFNATGPELSPNTLMPRSPE